MDLVTLEQIAKEIAQPHVGTRVQIPILCQSLNLTSTVYVSFVRYHITKISIPRGSSFNNPCNLVIGSNRVIENLRVFGGITDGSTNTLPVSLIIEPGDEVFFEATPPAVTFIGSGRTTILLVGNRIN